MDSLEGAVKLARVIMLIAIMAGNYLILQQVTKLTAEMREIDVRLATHIEENRRSICIVQP